jgi:ankyrin repeat protein
MKKKDIKEFFKAIRNSDLERVDELIKLNKEYISICNFAPPKKDDGQSGLQVSFKTGNFEIARLLIESGADVNFIEESEINDWTAPVLHDCIRAAIFNTETLEKDPCNFNKAKSLLTLMLSKGADPNGIDSYGNNCLHRAILDSQQMIKHPYAQIENGLLLNQLKAVFYELIEAGAEVKLANDKRPDALDMIKIFGLEKYELIK